jgi:hypothetical protein
LPMTPVQVKKLKKETPTQTKFEIQIDRDREEVVEPLKASPTLEAKALFGTLF